MSSEREAIKRDAIGWVGGILAAMGIALSFSGWYVGFRTSITPGIVVVVIGLVLVLAWGFVRKKA